MTLREGDQVEFDLPAAGGHHRRPQRPASRQCCKALLILVHADYVSTLRGCILTAKWIPCATNTQPDRLLDFSLAF